MNSTNQTIYAEDILNIVEDRDMAILVSKTGLFVTIVAEHASKFYYSVQVEGYKKSYFGDNDPALLALLDSHLGNGYKVLDTDMPKYNFNRRVSFTSAQANYLTDRLGATNTGLITSKSALLFHTTNTGKTVRIHWRNFGSKQAVRDFYVDNVLTWRTLYSDDN